MAKTGAQQGNEAQVERNTIAAETRSSLPVKPLRGFARLPKDELKALASKGGKAAHELGLAHEWTEDEAREAGRIGGKKTQKERREHERVEGGRDPRE